MLVVTGVMGERALAHAFDLSGAGLSSSVHYMSAFRNQILWLEYEIRPCYGRGISRAFQSFGFVVQPFTFCHCGLP